MNQLMNVRVRYNMEIERKFLMDGFPTGYEVVSEQLILQAYLYTSEPEVRIHRAINKHGGTDSKLTIKTGGDLSRLEIESIIKEKDFDDLLVVIGKPYIVKEYKRYKINNNLFLEVSCVDNQLYYAEVEFNTVEQANAFTPLECMGKEVTCDDSYKMKNYWDRTRNNKPTTTAIEKAKGLRKPLRDLAEKSGDPTYYAMLASYHTNQARQYSILSEYSMNVIKAQHHKPIPGVKKGLSARKNVKNISKVD
jgi:adenylate cyclase